MANHLCWFVTRSVTNTTSASGSLNDETHSVIELVGGDAMWTELQAGLSWVGCGVWRKCTSGGWCVVQDVFL